MSNRQGTADSAPGGLRKRALVGQARNARQAEEQRKKEPKAPIPRNQRLQLSPIDHTVSRCFVGVHLCFPFEGDEGMKTKAQGRVFHAYAVALQRWPFLAGEVIQSEANGPNALQVKYVLRPTLDEMKKWFGTSAALDNMWTYDELMRWGAAPGWLSNRLCTFANPVQVELCRKQMPVMVFNQTFVEGGLVLSFSFNHCVLDGPSFKQFLQVFAIACASGHKQWTTPIADSIQDRHNELAFLMPKTGTKRKGYDPVAHCEEYCPSKDFLEPPRRCRTVIFEFKHARLAELKRQVIWLIEQSKSNLWVSTTDCLCGLIWVAVMRARACRLLPSETEVKFTTQVDARSRVSRALPEYMGNLNVAATAKTTLERLLGELNIARLSGTAGPNERLWDSVTHEVLGIRNDIELSAITRAAVAIRKAINAVDEKYVKHHMAINSTDAAKIRNTNAYLRAGDISNTGVDFSSWKDWLDSAFDPRGKLAFGEPPKLDGKMRFDIPGVQADYPDFVRTSNPLLEGSCILLPRRTGGHLGEHAPWEVMLCLCKEEMAEVRSVTELGGWGSRVRDRDVKDVLKLKAGTAKAGESRKT